MNILYFLTSGCFQRGICEISLISFDMPVYGLVSCFFQLRLSVKLGLEYDITNVFYINGFLYIFVFEFFF